jgi:hypothetical protein
MTAAPSSPDPRRPLARLGFRTVLVCLALPIASVTGCASSSVPRTAAQGTDEASAKMDMGLELLADHSYDKSAATFYGVFSTLPDSDLRRDAAAFHLAESLVPLGFVQAAAEHYFGVVSRRRAPEFVNKSLIELKPLYENHEIDRDRLVEGVLYGNQYGEVSPEVADFVEYLQALTEVRHGFVEWGHARMEALAKAKKSYSYYAMYSLAVERMARHEDAPATEGLNAVVRATDATSELKDEARLALARIAYETKRYDDAWVLFSRIRSPIRLDDAVILEKAWDLVANGHLQRALGFMVGLGAPAYRRIFAPDRDLIRALALHRLCQYRAAHVAVSAFRAVYGPVLAAIRNGKAPVDEPSVRKWAVEGDSLLAETEHLRARLKREQAAVESLGDQALRAHVASIYASQIAHIETTIARMFDRSATHVVDELLRVEEQMNLIDYEVGIGLFKAGGAPSATATIRPEDIPAVSDRVYFRFDGEYWSDEINDYTVLADDRCVK